MAEPVDSMSYAASIIGDRWSLLLVRQGMMGARRFGDFRRELGISKNVLTSRLGGLVSNGVFSREPYQEQPRRHEYRLTERGHELFPVLLAMLHWGDTWRPDRPPDRLTHTVCGSDGVHAEPACSSCGGVISTDAVRILHTAPRSRDRPEVAEPEVELVEISFDVLP